MSLINDMLRDLEARRSDELKRQNLQSEIRPLPAAPAKSWGLILALAGALMLLLVGGIFFWWYSITPAPKLTVAAVTTTTILPLPAPVLVQPPKIPTVRAENLQAQLTVSSSTTTSLSVAQEPIASESPLKSAPVLPTPVVEKTTPLSLKDVKEVAKVSVVPEKLVPPTRASMTEQDKAPESAEIKGGTAGKIEVKSILATPRERADAGYRSARVLIASGRGGEAVDVLRSALRHDAEYNPARQLLIHELLEQKRIDDAMLVLAEGLAQQPKQVSWAMSLARLQVEKNDLAGAERTLAQHAAQATEKPEYLGFHGHIYYRLGRFREAIALYQSATRLQAAEGRWWFGLGVALESEGRSNEARDAFRQALATGTLNQELSAQAMQRQR